MKYLLGILAGVVTGTLLVFAIEFLAHNIYPLPEDLSKDEKAVLEEWLKQISPIVLSIIIFAHVIGSFVGAIVAILITNKKPLITGSIIGAIFLFFGIVNVVMLKHPLWFAIADLSIYFPAAFSGVYISSKLKNVI
jgi:hypothetical protein